MKKGYILFVTITAIFLFSACGDGKGDFDTGDQKITIAECEIYTAVQENDLLVKDEDNTTVKVIHDANNTKKICVLKGSAHIVREK